MLGTGVAVLYQNHPLTIAAQLAQLEVRGGVGRVELDGLLEFAGGGRFVAFGQRGQARLAVAQARLLEPARRLLAWRPGSVVRPNPRLSSCDGGQTSGGPLPNQVTPHPKCCWVPCDPSWSYPVIHSGRSAYPGVTR